MGKQGGQPTQVQHHQELASHHQAGNHSSDPFTHEEKILIQMAHATQKFEGHHHHHSHHEKVEYRKPFALTTDLGLFALKKLNAMNPDLLTEQHKRLLNPSAPGVITSLVHGLILVAMPIYTLSVWRNFGFKAFLRPVVSIPLGALVGTSIGFQVVASYLREQTFAIPRSKMVDFYKGQYGQKYLIDVLEPTFRLPEQPL